MAGKGKPGRKPVDDPKRHTATIRITDSELSFLEEIGGTKNNGLRVCVKKMKKVWEKMQEEIRDGIDKDVHKNGLTPAPAAR